jgi:hypothetical protein
MAAARIGDFKYRFTDQPTGWFGSTEKVDGQSSPTCGSIRKGNLGSWTSAALARRAPASPGSQPLEPVET